MTDKEHDLRSDDRAAAARERFAGELAAEAVSGGAFAVVHQGRVRVSHSHGLAERESGRPVDADTLFALASLTKVFTAMAALLLVDRGLLRWDGELGSYLPRLPNPTWAPVTVGQLVTMRGGFPNLGEAGGPDRNGLALLRRLARGGGPTPWHGGEIPWRHLLAHLAVYDLPPGEQTFCYSNVSYLVLGWLIQAVAPERDYEMFLQESLLRPLGLTSTRMKTVPLEEPAAVPYEHEPHGGRHRRAPVRPPERSWSAGGLVSTLGDLVRLEQAFAARRLLSAAAYRRMWSPAAGEERGYGCGWEVQVRGDHGPRVRCLGTLAGVSAGYLRYLDHDLAVVLLANGRHPRSHRLLQRLAHGFLPPAPAAVSGPPPAASDGAGC